MNEGRQPTIEDAMKLVKPTHNLEADYGQPEDYEDYDEPDFGDTEEVTEESLEEAATGPEGTEEEEPEDLRAAFIKAQAEVQRLRSEKDRPRPQEAKTPEEWVAQDPSRGPLGEDGRCSRDQVEAYYHSRQLAADMKVARMEMEREAALAVSILDMLSDAGLDVAFDDATGYRESMSTFNSNLAEVVDKLVQAEVKAAVREVQERWGVGKLHGVSPQSPKAGHREDLRVKQAREAVQQDRSPMNVARLIRARQQSRQG